MRPGERARGPLQSVTVVYEPSEPEDEMGDVHLTSQFGQSHSRASLQGFGVLDELLCRDFWHESVTRSQSLNT